MYNLESIEDLYNKNRKPRDNKRIDEHTLQIIVKHLYGKRYNKQSPQKPTDLGIYF